ncbi:MAG: hypothetical protein COA63_010670 [Methylophaga sp.]|nr:hypothetical protein [Methylophaga sp.]
MSDVRLKIDGIIHAGWKDVVLSFSLESIANTFQLSLTDKWANDAEPRRIKTGSACEVWIGNTKVITGYIDDVTPQYDARNHTVTVSGRSKAGDLVDCSHAGQQFSNRHLKQLADAVCQPFDIQVLVADGVDISQRFRNAQEIETGETIFEFLEQLARYRAVRLVSNVDGDIVITQAGKSRVNTALILGENILSASGQFSQRDRYSDITVIGSQGGSDDGWGNVVAHIKAKSSDKNINRHRPMVLNANDGINLSDAKKQAQWEINTRFGRGKGIVYTINGWLHDAGLWQPNVLVPVKDSFLSINSDMLISEVQLIMDDQGQRTELRVMPPEAFELVALPEPTIEDEGGW